MGLGDNCYPNFVPIMMDKFEHHLYLSYFNSFNPSLTIEMKFKYSSVYPVTDNNFLHRMFGHSAVRRHKKFKC